MQSTLSSLPVVVAGRPPQGPTTSLTASSTHPHQPKNSIFLVPLGILFWLRFTRRRIANGPQEHQCRTGPHYRARWTTVHGDAQQERHGLADGQDEGHGKRGYAARDPVHADDADELGDGIQEKVQEDRGYG